MKSEWLHRKGSRNLILFCNGWGMDGRPFTPLGSDNWDVLMFHNYQDLVPDREIQELFDQYPKVILLAWSMGVWAGQKVFAPYKEQLFAAVAINGTLCPVHDRFGIAVATAKATCEQLNEKSRLKFYQRMCREREVYKKFMANGPARSTADQKDELKQLLEMVQCDTPGDPIYQRALVAEKDFIISSKNQLQFWNPDSVQLIAGYHFLFYAYDRWDELAEIGCQVWNV